MKNKKTAKAPVNRRIGRAPKTARRRGKTSEAAKQSAMQMNRSLDAEFVRHNIHDSLQPIHRLADKANMPFLAYLIGMAMEEALDGAD